MFVNVVGWLALGAVGAWAAFYCLKRAKGSTWAHWFGFGIALLVGFAMVGTQWDGAIDWAASYFVLGGAAILTVVLGLPALFDIIKDRKPDTIAILAALILPSILAVGISQIGQFVGDALGNAKQTRASTGWQGR